MKLHPDEWDFSTCEPSLVVDCFAHEYARTALPLSPWFAAQVAEARRVYAGMPFLPLEIATDESPPHYIRIALAHDFADSRFLAKKRRAFDIDPEHSPLSEIQPDIASSAMQTEQTNREWFRERGADEWRIALGESTPPRGYLPHRAAFYIDWNYSPSAIAKAFREWLRANAPKGHAPIHRQGVPSYVKQRRGDLTALGVWRLMREARAAADLLQMEIRKATPKRRFLVASTESEIHRLRARAADILKTVFRVT